MSALDVIVDSIDRLSVDELQRLQGVLEERLSQALAEEQQKEENFLQFLLKKGLITSIPDRSKSTPESERPDPIVVEGPPVSETIIKERR